MCCDAIGELTQVMCSIDQDTRCIPCHIRCTHTLNLLRDWEASSSMRRSSLLKLTSKAITATAPASSAILACSAFITSIITPPFNICASPTLTPNVPVPTDECASPRDGKGTVFCALGAAAEGVWVPGADEPLGRRRFPSLSRIAGESMMMIVCVNQRQKRTRGKGHALILSSPLEKERK